MSSVTNPHIFQLHQLATPPFTENTLGFPILHIKGTQSGMRKGCFSFSLTGFPRFFHPLLIFIT